MNIESVTCPGELDPSSQHTFNAALGWYELGAYAESLHELSYLTEAQQLSFDVLSLLHAIHSHSPQKDHDQALRIAHLILDNYPDEPGGYLRTAASLNALNLMAEACGALQELYERLLKIETTHPIESLPELLYNMSCYLAKMDRFKLATGYLIQLYAVSLKFYRKSYADPDLQALWNWVGGKTIRQLTEACART